MDESRNKDDVATECEFAFRIRYSSRNERKKSIFTVRFGARTILTLPATLANLALISPAPWSSHAKSNVVASKSLQSGNDWKLGRK
jgi:hypothetical protein